MIGQEGLMYLEEDHLLQQNTNIMVTVNTSYTFKACETPEKCVRRERERESRGRGQASDHSRFSCAASTREFPVLIFFATMFSSTRSMFLSKDSSCRHGENAMHWVLETLFHIPSKCHSLYLHWLMQGLNELWNYGKTHIYRTLWELKYS